MMMRIQELTLTKDLPGLCFKHSLGQATHRAIHITAATEEGACEPVSGFRPLAGCLSACLATLLPPSTKIPCRPGACKPFLPITPFNPHPESYGAAFPMCFAWWGWGGIGQTARSSDALLRCSKQMARKWNLIPGPSDSRGPVITRTPPTELYWVTGKHRYISKRSGGERKQGCWIFFSLW